MELKKTYEKDFDIGGDKILCAIMVNSNEWVMLLSNGQVLKWDIAEGQAKYLFSVQSDTGGFDLTASCAVYAMDSFAVVVNERKTHGFVYNAKTNTLIPISREDYHADVSPYPIALYRDDAGEAHMIYAVAWNHLQIMDLEAQIVLTANKTLIIDQEVDRKFYEKHPQIPVRMDWPRTLDYFYGPLSLSPDKTKFLSRGWAWGSTDDFRIFDLDHFISHPHVGAHYFWGAEHTNRPMCWINDRTLATTYYPYRDENERGKSTRVHLYDAQNASDPIRDFIISDSEEVYGEIFYNPEHKILVQFEDGYGTLVYDLDGRLVLRDKSFMPKNYYPDLNIFLSVLDNTIAMHQLI